MLLLCHIEHNNYIMPRKVAALLPSTDELLRQLGDRLRLARQRRRLSAKQVAARAGMVPMTLRSLERGGSGVTIGAYAAVMQVLGVEKDLGLLVTADPVGRALQDARISAPTKAATRQSAVPAKVRSAAQAHAGTPARGTASERSLPRAVERHFTSARALAALLDAPPAPRAKAKRR
jgi:transcriptional regulator with XRE-family HTH domain